MSKFNKDYFRATLIWHSKKPAVDDQTNVTQLTGWLDKIMEEACNVAALRIGSRKPRRQVYWWQESAAILRQECIGARRLWQRAKKGRPREIIEELGISYKLKRKELRAEISKLKSAAWQELIGTIDEDPWGMPYRIVFKKLKSASPSLSKLLDREILLELMDTLFPRNIEPH